MLSKIDPAVRSRALRMIADHPQDYPSDTALVEAARFGATSDEQAVLKRLTAENERLREDLDILARSDFFRRGARPPQPGINAAWLRLCPAADASGAYCLAMATRSRSSGSMKWS